MTTPEPHEHEQQQADPLDPRLARRLFVAFLIIGALTVLSAFFLPRANLDIPWFVFAITFIAIVAAALAPLFEGRPEEEGEEEGDVAGRIGRSKPHE